MRLSIATRVFIGFVAVLACSAAVSAYGVARLQRIGERLSMVSPYGALTRAVSQAEAFQKYREQSTDRLLAEPDPALRKNLVDLYSTYFARVVGERLGYAAQQVAAARRDAADAAALDRIAERIDGVRGRIDDEERATTALVAQLGRAGNRAPNDEPSLQDAIKVLKTSERRVENDFKQLGAVLQDQMNQGLEEAERQERAARLAVLGLSVLAFSLGVVILLFTQRALRPIGTLTAAAQRLGRGAPEAVAVPEQGGDELAVLAREFNAMAQRLAARERELRAQGEALLRSERLAAIGRIAAQITHEIRNPLSSISLNAEELGERAPAARELCDAIVREVDRLTAITEEYLRFARLPKPQLARVAVNEAVRELLDFVEPELQAAGVRLVRELAAARLEAHADVAQLRQLLLNLIRNAREAMAGGGVLTVSTSADGKSVEVAVRDTGPGIPRERLARIFDPFFTTKERGTGLGLALSQEIAQEHGGALTCASTPGAGTTFVLRLPAAPPLREEAAAPAIAHA